MILILTLLLFFLLIFSFYWERYSLLSPWLIAIFMFFLASIIAAISMLKWDVSISAKTVLVIFVSLVCWGIGDFLGSNVNFRKKPNKNFTNKIEIPLIVIIIIVIFMLYILYLYYYYILNVSYKGGYKGGDISVMLQSARYALHNLNYEFPMSFLLGQGLIISKTITYLLTFILIYNYIFYKLSLNNILLFIPIIVYCFQIFLSTGRIDFLRYSFYCLIILFISWKIKHNWNNKIDFKILKTALISITAVIVSFYILGSLTNKTDKYSLKDTVSIYIGSPIVTLDNYINNERPENILFGQETLYNVYNFARNFNPEIPKYKLPLEFINLDGYDTNVYTALRRYIQDYGIYINFLIMLILGFIYRIGLNFVKSHRFSLSMILYSFYFFPVIEIANEERFFINVFSVNTVYSLVYLCMFYYILIYKKHNKLNFKVRVGF